MAGTLAAGAGGVRRSFSAGTGLHSRIGCAVARPLIAHLNGPHRLPGGWGACRCSYTSQLPIVRARRSARIQGRESRLFCPIVGHRHDGPAQRSVTVGGPIEHTTVLVRVETDKPLRVAAMGRRNINNADERRPGGAGHGKESCQKCGRQRPTRFAVELNWPDTAGPGVVCGFGNCSRIRTHERYPILQQKQKRLAYPT